ncbi:MAG: hypothetical protein GEU80_00255 [Dehalococcoidia bacterium]|nr:hypothetical protein [Dehalococcoidia bacterium]
MLRRWLAVLLACACTALVATLGPEGTPRADACAFDTRTPETYEADSGRSAYLLSVDAAAADLLFPGDSYFGLPAIEAGGRNDRIQGPRRIPPQLLRAIGWVESDLTMASRSVRFESIGAALVSFDCGHGVMQVTSGMTLPLGDGDRPSGRQTSVATHYAYNIARGAAILAEKWNQAPEIRPIVGTDTGSDPNVLENWYYAVWAYNGFTGPGSNQSNHPLDPSLGSWPRSEYRCDGTQSRNRYPYQEMVWGCVSNPPSRDGRVLWAAVDISYPDFTSPRFFDALAPANFSFPYSAMDIPTPQPAHVAQPSLVDAGAVARLLGTPRLDVTSTPITIRTAGAPQQQTFTVPVRNAGGGILSWQATSSANFIVLSPPAGAAVGPDIRCTSGGCPSGQLTVTVNPTLLPAARQSGTITISSPNGAGPPVTIRVEVFADFEVGVPGTSRAP